MANTCPVSGCGANVDVLATHGNVCAVDRGTLELTDACPKHGLSLGDETRMQTTGPITATEVEARMAESLARGPSGADVFRHLVDGVVAALPDDNPKTKFGVQKTPMHLVPMPAIIEMAEVFRLGAAKYGAYNWRKDRVSASVYYGAGLRHMAAWWEGEDFDPESGRPHLAHAMDCFAIVIDAAHHGMLNDDRPPIPAREACKGKPGFDERGRPAPINFSLVGYPGTVTSAPYTGPSFDVAGEQHMGGPR